MERVGERDNSTIRRQDTLRIGCAASTRVLDHCTGRVSVLGDIV